MRRILVVALLVVFALSMSAFAQEKTKMPMGAGVTAGLSLGNATGSDAAALSGETKKMRLGFAFGAFYSFEPVKGFTIQPELMYVQKGVKYEEDAGGKLTIKTDYLEIPVLAKWTPDMKESKIQPTIFVGPFVGIIMSAKAKAEGFAGDSLNGEVDIKDQLKSTDFGVAFGAGLGMKTTKGELFFDARYDLGLSKVYKDIGGVTPDVKSATILVLVGYKFDI